MTRKGQDDDFHFTVVIPLFNKAKFIRAALESVLAQTHPAREILVVDDGSSDDGPAIVSGLGAGQVRLIRQTNAGPGLARNRGIEEAKQPWVAFLDADDLWLPDHLHHLAELHRAFPGAAVLASGYEEFRGEPPTVPNRPNAEPRQLDFFSLDPGKPGLSSSSVAAKGDSLRNAGGFARDFPGEDVDLWIRLGLDLPIVLSPKVTALYRRHGEGLTHHYLAAPQANVVPIFDTLEAALSDPLQARRHGAIAQYRDRWRIILASQALLVGSKAEVRRILSGLDKRSPKAIVLRAATYMPGPLFQLVKRVKKAFNRR
jgi:glycosyltransferase involved in cell wall biosynthesis